MLGIHSREDLAPVASDLFCGPGVELERGREKVGERKERSKYNIATMICDMIER